jgi:hypothetical protein
MLSPIDRGRLCADILSGESRDRLLQLRKKVELRVEVLLGQGKDDKDENLAFLLGFEDRLFGNLKNSGNEGANESETEPAILLESRLRESRVEFLYYCNTSEHTVIHKLPLAPETERGSF